MLSVQSRTTLSSLDTFLSSVYLEGLIIFETNDSLQRDLQRLKTIHHNNCSINELQQKKDIFPDIDEILVGFYGPNIEQMSNKYFKKFFHIWKEPSSDSYWLETRIMKINDQLIEMLSEKNSINIIKNLHVSNPKSMNEIIENESNKPTFYRKIPDLINFGFINIFGISIHANGRKTMFTKTFDEVKMKINENVELKLKINNKHLQSSKYISKIIGEINYT